MDKEKKQRFIAAIIPLYLYFTKGDRYENKEKTIKEWMDRDKAKDELYESAEAPEGIRCLTCRNLLKPTFKELWSELNKPDRILFMYDCPNKCLPHRAFFSDGEEWRVKPNLCPQCGTKLNQEEASSDEKLITKYICSKCGHTKIDEFEWSHKEKEVIDQKSIRKDYRDMN
jgi:ribosomal protein S27AE